MNWSKTEDRISALGWESEVDDTQPSHMTFNQTPGQKECQMCDNKLTINEVLLARASSQSCLNDTVAPSSLKATSLLSESRQCSSTDPRPATESGEVTEARKLKIR